MQVRQLWPPPQGPAALPSASPDSAWLCPGPVSVRVQNKFVRFNTRSELNSIIGGSRHKYNFCCDKSMLVETKTFVEINTCSLRLKFCHDKHNFVTTKVLWRQAYFCCDKRHVLLWQTHVCCVCHEQTLVATKMILVAAPTNNKIQPPRGSPQDPCAVRLLESWKGARANACFWCRWSNALHVFL